MEKSVLQVELVKARKRLIDVQEVLKTSVGLLNAYDKGGFATMAALQRAKHKRYEAALIIAQKAISELEKASGALPLK